MSIIDDLKEKAKQFIFRRQSSYQITFPKNGIHSDRVLADMARFCRANESTFHQDPRAHAVLEGRREVWLRFQHHLKLSPDDIWRLYGKDKL